MTRTPNHQISRPTPLVIDTEMGQLDEASRRAWTESMAVSPFGSDYLVECASAETQLVSLEDGFCTCGRDDTTRCEHRRRVAIEINLGRLPAPTPSEVDCACCGSDVSQPGPADGPPLCADCRLEPGDLVVDTEGTSSRPLLVVSPVERRADEVQVSVDGPTVAEYPTNECGPDDPVVDVIYPDSISTDQSPQVYQFPVSRLAPVPERDSRQARLSEFGVFASE